MDFLNEIKTSIIKYNSLTPDRKNKTLILTFIVTALFVIESILIASIFSDLSLVKIIGAIILPIVIFAFLTIEV